MGSKLLFILGIVAAHGALAAAWVQQDAPQTRMPMTACVNTPAGGLPDFTPRRELLAMAVMQIDFDSEVMQP
jgi:hypothetical protein